MAGFGMGFGILDGEGGEAYGEAPNMDVLVIDDTLPAVEKVTRYASATMVLHRMFVLKALDELLAPVTGDELLDTVLPLLAQLADDEERVVRVALAAALPELVTAVVRIRGGDGQVSDGAYKALMDVVLPMYESVVSDDDAEVRSTGIGAAGRLARVLAGAGLARVVDEVVVPMALGLTSDDQPESVRVDVCGLLDALAPNVPLATVHSSIVPELTRLASDPMFRVRKAVALNITHICADIALPAPVVETSLLPAEASSAVLDPLDDSDAADGSGSGPSRSEGVGTGDAPASVAESRRGASPPGMVADIVSSLLHLYESLAKDSIWGVRKACAESLVALATVVDDEVRSSVLVAHFESFVNDVSRWVRSAAFEALGPFIARFSGASLPGKLLEYYNDMAKPAYIKSIDAEITTHCAFNFPAVMLTVGREGGRRSARCTSALPRTCSGRSGGRWHTRSTPSPRLWGPRRQRPTCSRFLTLFSRIWTRSESASSPRLPPFRPCSRRSGVPTTCRSTSRFWTTRTTGGTARPLRRS
ncbi:serine/threonine-protein phosphatase 4 regulatory subunit 1 [Thecamonas trahens ATCC 50062]|uniref:Serine/threonine-protein phosphatase 4 regulatory subunit 1 n=1 Tax=Thecamonas trahens ATCC 50062 TaxID=461836 RepID=A0A0L0DFN8_THETB|nr:serine/threonine-protein phosphatase 4 regulatory subunit 1 [Thecamonas trahens ATCC 50062]KNC51109.1 serine/threonine-protein phosphatase 4 regulatory subunit 1 [Thecamonas trahens ATCC 50062]|eukprot:XP_013756317.1 serine/threonine-protein phosphatase 4 regulatory subunit 1 [Thecamonas trahens ATCC 50062]